MGADARPGRPRRRPRGAPRREARARAQLPRRAALHSARAFPVFGGLPRPRLPRVLGSAQDLGTGDWAMLSVALSLVVIVIIGVLGKRLASIERPIAPPPAATPEVLSALSVLPAAPAAILPTASPTPLPTPPVVSAVDAGGPSAGVRLRAEPSLDARIVERLVHGTQVTELGPEASVGNRVWRQVRTAAGSVGWIDASLLRRSGAPGTR